MFESLGDNLARIFDKIKGKGVVTEEDLNAALREVRIALLEADVALPVAKEFIEKVRGRALGAEVVKSVSPAQMIIKIVQDYLTEILGSEAQELNLNTNPPAVILMAGLQGSGKTTTTAKLGLLLKNKQKKKVLLASLDVYRPAAQQQLEVLGQQTEIDTLEIVAKEKPVAITKRALKRGKSEGYDIVILDTAGRLHIDDELMKELQEVKELSKPIETLLVADAMTGQDAVNIAKEFNEKIGVTGIVLTRLDGDTRGGAALSMTNVAGCAVKFAGVGEKIDEFEVFHPERVASRILGMGDIVSLVEQASENVKEEEAEKLAKKVMKGKFDLDDLASQLKTMRKMGGVGKLMGMIPGIGKIKKQLDEANVDDKAIVRQESIIYSMTKKERKFPKLINASRKKRIAAGAGVSVQDVNRLLKQFKQMSTMMKKLGKMDKKSIMRMGGNMLPPGFK